VQSLQAAAAAAVIVIKALEMLKIDMWSFCYICRQFRD
jgi:hypothetical protein